MKSSKKYLLAIDQGTTSTRSILFTAAGQLVKQQALPLEQFYPDNGWVEHDPEEIWQATLTTVRAVMAESECTAEEIAAIGITNQRETSLIWNRQTGKLLYNAIVWQDRRTADICKSFIDSGIEKKVTEKTGLLLDPYFSATKIAWILDHIPYAREQAEKGELAFGTIDCFLLWRLTRGKIHATDITNASRTLLLNIHTRQWDDELLKIFNIPKKILPQVMDNCADFGVTAKDWFGIEIPIAAMVGDQQAALIGQGCFQAGSMKSTFGTGCFVLLNTGQQIIQSQHRLLSTIAYQIQKKTVYAMEGSIFAAGSVVQWLRDQLGLITSAADSEKIAASLEDNEGVYLVPAFTGLGAPYWDPYARGAILGLTRHSKAAHIVRAGLESIVYQTKDLITAMINDGAPQPKELKVDGGMIKNNWLMQFLADLLNCQIKRAKLVETTALGAAYLAGLQIGIYSSLDEIAALHQVDKIFTPKLELKQREIWYLGWQKAVGKVRGVRSEGRDKF